MAMKHNKLNLRPNRQPQRKRPKIRFASVWAIFCIIFLLVRSLSNRSSTFWNATHGHNSSAAYYHHVMHAIDHHKKSSNDTGEKQIEPQEDNPYDTIQKEKQDKPYEEDEIPPLTIWSRQQFPTIENPLIVMTVDPTTNLLDYRAQTQLRICQTDSKSTLIGTTPVERSTSKTATESPTCPITLTEILQTQAHLHHFEPFHNGTRNITQSFRANTIHSDVSLKNTTALRWYDSYVRSQWNQLILFINEAIAAPIVPNNNSSMDGQRITNSAHGEQKKNRFISPHFVRKSIVGFSYWSSDLQRHVALEFETHDDLLDFSMVRKCSGRECPIDCKNYHREDGKIVASQQEQHQKQSDILSEKGYFLWDEKDRLCKSTHPATQPPYRSYGGACNCDHTCFTPSANQLYSYWPWSNQSQRDYFYPMSSLPSSPTNDRHRADTNNERSMVIQEEETIPPPWKEESDCQKCAEERRMQTLQERFLCPASSTNNATATDKVSPSSSSSPSLSCPIHCAADNHMIFFPDHKLIFCGIPKVGITEWLKFFRYTYGAQDYLSIPHYKRDRAMFLVSKLSQSKAEEILLKDPTWTKAVFFRNPAERLLSAYLDKVIYNDYTQKIFHIHDLANGTRTKLNFEEFVNLVTYNSTFNSTQTASCRREPRGLHWCTDPHWRPQIMSCGLDALLPHFDFVGTMEYASDQTKLLLERVGLWETYGKNYDDGRSLPNDSKFSICNTPSPDPLMKLNGNDASNSSTNTNLGFNQRGPSETYKHATNSKKSLSRYYTPELLAKVKKAYALDYMIWDELVSLQSNQFMKGSDLKIVQNYCDSTS